MEESLRQVLGLLPQSQLYPMTYSDNSTGLARLFEGLMVEPQNLTAGQPGLAGTLGELETLLLLQELRKRSMSGSPGQRSPTEPVWDLTRRHQSSGYIPTRTDFPGMRIKKKPTPHGDYST